MDVHALQAPNRPPASLKLPVDLLAGALFGRQGHGRVSGRSWSSGRHEALDGDLARPAPRLP